MIPNLQFREADKEVFDENWIEYIRRDVEGSDTDTRRRMASELVKALTASFKETVTSAMSGYVGKLLAEYSADPARNWKQKDCAIFLITALTVRSKTDTQGATSTNELVNIGDFFTGHIVPELQAPVGRGSDLLKADALRFLTTFRTQIPKQAVLQLMPAVVALLASEHNVVHSYAAICIERMLTVKDGPGVRGRPDLRYMAADVVPFREQMLHNLFCALTLPDSGENDYLMKSIMRVIAVLGPEVKPVAPTCMVRARHCGAAASRRACSAAAAVSRTPSAAPALALSLCVRATHNKSLPHPSLYPIRSAWRGWRPSWRRTPGTPPSAITSSRRWRR